jgi:hypothetical protein
MSSLYLPRQLPLRRDCPWAGRTYHPTSHQDERGDSDGSFKRSKKSGKLTSQGCLSDDPDLGPSGTAACRLTPRPGDDPGLRGATQLAFGGADLYVSAADDDAITRIKP